MIQPLTAWVCAIFLLLPSASPAQEGKAAIDKSAMPLEAARVEDFVPPGWLLEERVSGDLNGDAVPDLALKLIQEKRASSEDTIVDRQRALVVLIKGRDAKLHRAAVAEKLLQCTACGGAFYGFVEAPANVTIEKGQLVVNQDHGSRNVTEQTFRFRHQPNGKLVLIGLDVVDRDRVTGEVVNESTNFLTGRKIIKRYRPGKRSRRGIARTTVRSVSRRLIPIEEVNSESY